MVEGQLDAEQQRRREGADLQQRLAARATAGRLVTDALPETLDNDDPWPELDVVASGTDGRVLVHGLNVFTAIDASGAVDVTFGVGGRLVLNEVCSRAISATATG